MISTWSVSLEILNLISSFTSPDTQLERVSCGVKLLPIRSDSSHAVLSLCR